jgi:hypothetical protein
MCTHFVKNTVDTALMFQNPLGTLPLFVGKVSNHLNNFLFHLGHNLIIGLVCGSLDIEYGASHVLI